MFTPYMDKITIKQIKYKTFKAIWTNLAKEPAWHTKE